MKILPTQIATLMRRIQSYKSNTPKDDRWTVRLDSKHKPRFMLVLLPEEIRWEHLIEADDESLIRLNNRLLSSGE